MLSHFVVYVMSHGVWHWSSASSVCLLGSSFLKKEKMKKKKEKVFIIKEGRVKSLTFTEHKTEVDNHW